MLRRTKQRTSDENLINSDEILRSLTHRAAYRTQSTIRWILMPVGFVLIYGVSDEHWNVVGYTMFAVLFLTSVIFELILAYDGVFQGLDELRSKVVVDKRIIYRRAGWIFVQMIIFSLILGHFMDDDASWFDDIMQGIILGIVFCSSYFYRWRHIVDTRSR